MKIISAYIYNIKYNNLKKYNDLKLENFEKWNINIDHIAKFNLKNKEIKTTITTELSFSEYINNIKKFLEVNLEQLSNLKSKVSNNKIYQIYQKRNEIINDYIKNIYKEDEKTISEDFFEKQKYFNKLFSNNDISKDLIIRENSKIELEDLINIENIFSKSDYKIYKILFPYDEITISIYKINFYSVNLYESILSKDYLELFFPSKELANKFIDDLKILQNNDLENINLIKKITNIN